MSAPQVPCQHPAAVGRSPAVFDASPRMLRCGNYIDSVHFRAPKPRHGVCFRPKRYRMNLLLFVILVILVLGALPTWPYSQGWGYYPSGGLGLLLLILLIAFLVRGPASP